MFLLPKRKNKMFLKNRVNLQNLLLAFVVSLTFRIELINKNLSLLILKALF